MNSSGPPVISRLILVVLSLILVCLVLLVVRAYRGPEGVTASAQPAVEAVVPELREAPPLPRPPKPITFVPRHVSTGEPTTLPVTQSSGAVANVEPPPAAPALVFPPPLYTPGGSSPNAGRRAAENPAGGGGRNTAKLSGTVWLAGTPPPEIAIPLTPACGRISSNAYPSTRHYVVGTNGGLANVMVYVSAGISGSFPPAHGRLRLDQVGCMFEPYVFGVQAGEQFVVRNSDPELHNIHLSPRRNVERNISQPTQGQVSTLTLDKPELFVRIKCDLHAWMFAYVSVFEHPYFAVTDAGGNFQLPRGLPPGKFTITAVHHKAGYQVQKVTLDEGEARALHFEFEVPNPSQAGASSPRIPVGDEP